MLLHESDAQSEIAQKYRAQLDAMTKLHDTVVSMMTAGEWKVQKTRGVNPLIIQTMMGLLTKAMKTFGQSKSSANAVSTMTLALWPASCSRQRSLSRSSLRRSRSSACSCITHMAWSRASRCSTSGQRRKGSSARRARRWLSRRTMVSPCLSSKLPVGTNLKRHWSGLGSIQEAMSELRGGDAMYATLYRHTSAISHASDFEGGHFSIDDSGEMVWEVFSAGRGLRGTVLCCSSTAVASGTPHR